MSWSRVALVNAAGESDEALDKVGALFGYKALHRKQAEPKDQINIGKESDAEKLEQPLANAKESTRPPARFIRVKKFIEHKTGNDQRPKYLNDPSMRLSADTTGSYDFPAAEPLLTSSRLLPFILTNLGVARDSRRLNHKLISKQVSQAKALQRLPYVAQLRWPKRLHILVDSSRHLEPYWGDFESITNDLKQQIGADAVKAITIEEDTLDDSVPLFTPWPISDDDVEADWFEPPSDEPVLILSDLGITHSKSRLRVKWRRFAAKHLKQSNVLTLSPAQRSLICKKSAKSLRPNPLHDGRLKNHAVRSGYVTPVINPAALRNILTLLSALPLVDVALLRKLRLALDWGGSELEGVIWNHREMVFTGLGICLSPTVIESYRLRYKRQFADTEAARVLWRIANEHHQHAYAGLKSVEAYSRTALDGQVNQSSLQYMQCLAASLEQTDNASDEYQALAAQCKSILAFCPDSLSTPELSNLAHELLSVAYKEEIEREDWQAIPLANVQLSKLQAVLGNKDQTEYRRWYAIEYPSSEMSISVTPHKPKEGRYHYPPILEFNAPKNLPITIQRDDYITNPFTSSVLIDFSEKEITIESGESVITLDTIAKPNWANAIGRNKECLWVSFEWVDETILCHWRIVDGIGAWQVDAPFGVDQYGLYTDLALIPDHTQRFRWIPAGTFQMGSPESEPERLDRETQHQVTLTQGYWLADTTVTQAQWQAVTGENPSHFKGENLPVENVSWDDSQDFINKLKKDHPHIAFQLPSEAQWEYACRAGTVTPFSFGVNITPEQVNYDGNYPYDNGTKGEYRETTVPVKSLLCNQWGLYEMHGNVFEWCRDSWQDDLGSQPVTDPESNEEGAKRVVRGGSWYGSGGGARSAYRNRHSPDDRFDNFGLRLSFGHPSASSGGSQLTSLAGDQKIKIFISYSNLDIKHKSRLEKRLDIIKNKLPLEYWSDTELKIGDSIFESIVEASTNSDILILILSRDSSMSDYFNNELELLLNKNKDKVIVPINIDKTEYWDQHEFISSIQAFPSTEMTFNARTHPKFFWDQFEKELTPTLKKVLAKKTAASSAEGKQ